MIKHIVLLFFLCVMYADLCAQNPADCVGAQAVCNNPNFTFSATPNNGNVNELPGTNSVSNPATNPASGNFGCLLVGENNPQWLLLNISTSGILEFSFGAAGSPNPQVGLYDWAMWPYNANTCNGIINNTLPPVRCNWNSAGIGGTGIGTPPPGGNTGNYEPALPVVAGQQFVICISNFSGVNTLVTFTSTGTAKIGCNNVFANSATVCPGQNALITPTVVNIPNPSYTIQPGNIISPGPVINVSSSSTQVFTISASTAMTSGSNIATGTFTLNVTTVQNLIVPGPLFYCASANASISAPQGFNSYTLSHPSGLSSSGPSHTFVLGSASPSMNGTYTVSASNPNGCLHVGTTQVTVFNPTSLNITGNTLVCQNGLLQLSASNPNIFNAQWTGPGGLTSSGTTLSIAPFQTNNNGVYTLQANVNLGPISCPSSATIQTDIVPVSPVFAGNSQTICLGGALQLSASANNALSYQWNGPAGFSSALQNPLIQNVAFNMGGTYHVYAAFSKNGTTCYSQASVMITIEKGEKFSIPGNASFCSGSALKIEGPAGANSYQWTGPNNTSTNQKDLFIAMVSSLHNGTYTLSLKSKFNCAFTSTININIFPALEMIKAPEDKIICKLANAHNSVSVRGGSGNYVYTYVPMSGIIRYGGDNIYASPLSSQRYTLSVTDPACPTTKLESQFVIDVLSLPQAQLSSNILQGCEPLSVKLRSQNFGVDPKTKWYIDQREFSNNDALNYTFKKAGVYPISVLLTDRNGCSARYDSEFRINVFPQPKPYFTFTPSHITTLTEEVSFQSQSRAGKIKNVQWYFNSNDSSSALNPLVKFKQASWQNIVLLLENEFGCIDTCIGKVQVHEELMIYVPNAFSPNGDGLNDEIKPIGEGISAEDYELSVFDRWGAEIFLSHDVNHGWNGKIQGAEAKADVYTYRLKFRSAESIVRKEIMGYFTLIR
ncbi:MAG: gliding motility-associated C-terminal domain-containing protein [Bacteroidia bacterium]|nr:gliding motility-associated C-terminal domain-containing protein [Bacteroidia bacterium]